MIKLFVSDARKIPLPNQSVDLIVSSPPYLQCRNYGIGAAKSLKNWVEFMLECSFESLRVSRGPVFYVLSGQTIKGEYQPGPETLMSELYKNGISLLRPCCWAKFDKDGNGTGIPGSGSKQWLRADWEYVLALKNQGPLPYANPLFEKKLPKFNAGGKMRIRDKDGQRQFNKYQNPVYVNPGNVVKARVGGGHQGDKECHENEAPFPEKLAEFFIKGWSDVGQTIYDPFCGSGTTIVTAEYFGRNCYGSDIRVSQLELTNKRIERRVVEGRLHENIIP